MGGDDRTVVHLLRHGEVYNPEGVLYGRLPGYFLSDLGQVMAERAATALANHDVTEALTRTGDDLALAHDFERRFHPAPPKIPSRRQNLVAFQHHFFLNEISFTVSRHQVIFRLSARLGDFSLGYLLMVG